MSYGFHTAAWVSILRVLVGSLVIGTFLSPTFWLSFAGSIGVILVLRITSYLQGWFSALGISVLTAIAHVFFQFLLAFWLFIPHVAIWKLFPVLLTFAILLGIINGILAQVIINRFHTGR